MAGPTTPRLGAARAVRRAVYLMVAVGSLFAARSVRAEFLNVAAVTGDVVVMRAILRLFTLLQLPFTIACFHGPVWPARDVAACPERLEDAALERERSYLAMLVALDARQYAILRKSDQRVVEAEFVSDFRRSDRSVRWLVRVRDDGTLNVSPHEAGTAQLRRTPAMFEALSFQFSGLRCRQLEWLRWEAQNRGLLRMGAPEGADAGANSLPAAESVSSQLASGDQAPRADLAERVVATRDALARTHLMPYAIGSAASAASLLLGTGFLIGGFVNAADENCEDTDSCSSRRAAMRVTFPTGAALTVLGATGLWLLLPRAIRARDQHMQLRMERDYLRRQQVDLVASPSGAMLRLRGQF